MRTQTDSQQRPRDGVSIGAVVVFIIALGISILLLNIWGEHILMRAMLGTAWGGYAFYCFGPDLIRLIKEARKKKQ